MPSPAFAVVGTGEEAINKLLPGLRIVGVEEGLSFFGGREEAGEIEGEAADESGALGRRGGCDVRTLEAGIDESIDGISGP